MRRRDFLYKSDICIGENDAEILKGYVLAAMNFVNKYNKDLHFTHEQKTELLYALELSGEDLTTQEAFDYYIKNS